MDLLIAIAGVLFVIGLIVLAAIFAGLIALAAFIFLAAIATFGLVTALTHNYGWAFTGSVVAVIVVAVLLARRSAEKV